MEDIQGVFLFNKPSKITSAGFLNKIKKDLHIPRGVKVGHGGTLDPFAQGLMVVAIGREYTKKLHNVLKKDTKEYKAKIILGAFSDTYDCDGNIIKTDIRKSFPTDKKIENVIKEISLRKTQTPPPFSAIKIHGVEAYKRSRRGEVVSLSERPACMKKYKLIGIERKEDKIIVNILLTVGAGFYIRSFANDLGKELKIGGYLNELIRTKVGDWTIENSINLDDAIKMGKKFKNTTVDI